MVAHGRGPACHWLLAEEMTGLWRPERGALKQGSCPDFVTVPPLAHTESPLTYWDSVTRTEDFIAFTLDLGLPSVPRQVF